MADEGEAVLSEELGRATVCLTREIESLSGQRRRELSLTGGEAAPAAVAFHRRDRDLDLSDAEPMLPPARPSCIGAQGMCDSGRRTA